MSCLGRVPASPRLVSRSAAWGPASRVKLRDSVRGSQQLGRAQGLRNRRALSPHPQARSSCRSPWPCGPHLPGRPRPPGHCRLSTGVRVRLSGATPALSAGRCHGARGAGPGPPRFSRACLARAADPAPARRALRSPTHGAAHPPSSPATVAGPRRALPPCWLLFPFPESVASGPSANQGSQLRGFPANGALRSCAAREPHGSCSSPARPRVPPPPHRGSPRPAGR